MKNMFQLLADKWRNQADNSTDVYEQAWLYACSGDLENQIKNNEQQDKIK